MLILILFTDQAQHEHTEYICHKSQLVRMLINQLLRRWTGDEIETSANTFITIHLS